MKLLALLALVSIGSLAIRISLYTAFEVYRYTVMFPSMVIMLMALWKGQFYHKLLGDNHDVVA